MFNWLIFFKERIPLFSYFIIASGFACGSLSLLNKDFSYITYSFVCVGIILFLVLLRLMDEVKDYDKDCIVYPQRPLPRGLIKIEECKKAIRINYVMMIFWNFLIYQVFSLYSGFLYSIVIGYSLLMYREFWISNFLKSKPFLYALSHQVVIFPLTYFALTSCSENLPKEKSLLYTLIILVSFLNYEIGRKLKPNAHPALQTYLYVYGKSKVVFILIGCLILLAIGSSYFTFNYISISFYLMGILGILIFYINPKIYKFIEVITSVSLILHIWLPTIYSFLQGTF
jgi:4-hydroxybenzoate polyprenyltransferase